jgi:hypothetical protein
VISGSVRCSYLHLFGKIAAAPREGSLGPSQAVEILGERLLQDSIVLAGNLSRAVPTKLDESSTEGQTPRRSHSFVLSRHPTNSVSRDWTRFKRRAP